MCFAFDGDAVAAGYFNFNVITLYIETIFNC